MKLEPLSPKELDIVVDASFAVLEDTGAMIYSEEALSLLQASGCAADGHRVKIGRELVRKCLRSAPEVIRVYNREGAPAMEVGGDNSYYGPGVTCPYVFDPYTMERVTATKQFVKDAAKVADALPNVDYLMSLCMIADETPLFADLQEVHALASVSAKPLLTWAFNKENLQGILELCAAAAGGAEKLCEKPFLMVYTEPISPLVHPKESLEKLMLLSKNGIPAVYSPGMTLGGTAPVTKEGALTVGLADSFVGAVISQLTRPGAPVILGANGGALDMRTCQSSYSSLEMCMMESAANQVYRLFGVPSFGLAGSTDHKSHDALAAVDSFVQTFMATLSRSNLIHDFGMMDIGMTGSLDLLVMCDEWAAMSKFVKNGFDVTPEKLAADVIRKVGPGGVFLTEEHTARHFRESLYTSAYFARTTYGQWESGGKKTTRDLVREKTLKLLKEHTPEPPSEDRRAAMDRVLAEYAKE